KLRYVKGQLKPQKQDLKRFVALVEKDSTKAALFTDYFIFEGTDGRWYKPSGIFLDEPFLETGLSTFYEALKKDAHRSALSLSYADSAISSKRLLKFAEA